METAYRDKYMEELEKASKEARIITKDITYLIPAMRFVGIAQRGNRNTYYYYHESEDRYYSETDFDRHMRKVIKNRRFESRSIQGSRPYMRKGGRKSYGSGTRGQIRY